VTEVLSAFIIRAMLMMEAESTSETSVNFYQTTRHNNPEDNHLQECMKLYLHSLTHFHIVPDSNLGPEAGYPEVFRSFTRFLRANARIMP
jgi:hypothetical protein